MRNCKYFLLTWFIVLISPLHCFLVFRTSPHTHSETVLLSSTEQAHDVRGEVRNFTEQDALPQVKDGRKYLCSLMLKWTLPFAVASPPCSAPLSAASDRPAEIATYRFLARIFSPPDSDDDFPLG